MKKIEKIAVASRSFSKHPVLREELSELYSHVQFNEEGKTYQGESLISFLKDHDSAIVGLEHLTGDVLTRLPQLKVISRFGVGLDTVDVKTAARLGIKLAVTAGANKRSVAELVIAFSIMMLRQLPLANQELRSGKWLQRKGRQLSDCTVGIIGMGAIGKDLALLLQAFNCNILTYDLVKHVDFCQQNQIQEVDLETLLQQSDIVTIHIPFTEQTQLILNAHRLSLMKSDAVLINVARGGLVDEHALKEMLKSNQLAGAAFDVFATEPLQDQELLALPNFFATPHIGGSTEEAILAMGRAAICGLERAVIPEY